MNVMSLLVERAVSNRMRFRGRVRRLAALIVVACLVPVVGSQSAQAASQVLAPGFGYLSVSDGTKLSINVVLPGPESAGPYPTVVEYSGYGPSNPLDSGLSLLFNALGYAYVGVNMRGTGCSGGSFSYFEPAQLTDGYEMIEAIAAQSWVKFNKVGMVGVSYSGISQLFVASTQPPSLAAIAPFSVIDDSYRSTLYPGGILNTGFAVDWAAQRMKESRAYGQPWTKARADAGDKQCALNQQLRSANTDLVAKINLNPFYNATIGDQLAPATMVSRITVPTFIAGAWQDEQTGARFANMLDNFSSTKHLYATLMNGLHTDSLASSVIVRLVEFLDLYVARRVPSMGVLQFALPLVSAGIFGAPDTVPLLDRFGGKSYQQALKLFEAEPSIEVLFEQGAAKGATPGSPVPRFKATFASWPPPNAIAKRWYLQSGGSLTVKAPTGAKSNSAYQADVKNTTDTFYSGSRSAFSKAGVVYAWKPPRAGTALIFTTSALTADTVLLGSGSADLYISSSTGDTDLEVTLSELRPDGSEVYVQSGWLRASHNALDTRLSSELLPVNTHLEADARKISKSSPTLVRVEILPVGHAFRKGSRLRVVIDAPGGNRAVWKFRSIVAGEKVTIWHNQKHPSSIVLSTVAGVSVPRGVPGCGALRGQPCRPRG